METSHRFPGYVDAPVLGSLNRAASGESVVFASGSVEPVEPVLRVFGHVLPCGPVGQASALKVAVMGGVVAGMALLSETYTLARAMGLPDDVVEDALGASPTAAPLSRTRSTTAHFPVRMAAEDLALALDRAPLPMIQAARRQVATAVLGKVVPDHARHQRRQPRPDALGTRPAGSHANGSGSTASVLQRRRRPRTWPGSWPTGAVRLRAGPGPVWRRR